MRTVSKLTRWSDAPRLFAAESVVDEPEREALLGLCRDEAGLEAAGIALSHTECGVSAELPITHHPLLGVLASRLEAELSLVNAEGSTFRMRSYRPGEGHPPHLDDYEIDGRRLVATAILCLEAPASGGETIFLEALGGALAVPHRPGSLLAWHNLDPEGEPDPSSRHLAAPVAAGHKVILSWFVYADPSALATAATGTPGPGPAPMVTPRAHPTLPGLGRRLVLLDDGVPDETLELLSLAAEERGIAVRIIDTGDFDFAHEPPLPPGDLIFRPAVSMHALLVEQHLWHAELGSFYRDADGPLFANLNAPLTFARRGIPVPRTFAVARADRARLRGYVEALGGLPVVIKMPGYSRGVGTMRADSLPALFSLVDYVLAEGGQPSLTTYVPDAVHWRLVVVGDRVVASYRNVLDPDDFRTSSSGESEDYVAAPPDEAATLAVEACRALRVAHGGVDLLAHPSGRLYVLEANFPCYYADAQLAVGVDVAGAMVDHLLAVAAERHPAPP